MMGGVIRIRNFCGFRLFYYDLPFTSDGDPAADTRADVKSYNTGGNMYLPTSTEKILAKTSVVVLRDATRPFLEHIGHPRSNRQLFFDQS
eukprot:12550649-Ditylum_brightwellii.AAC.1